jgi:regulator of nucleoside diphosphate kinase
MFCVEKRRLSMASRPRIQQQQRPIVITERDLVRLKHMLESAKLFRRDCEYIESLDRELDEAEVVASERLPRNIVTINSQVRITDLASKKQMVYTLVFPRDADYAEGKISVLAPIGAALLGERVGDVVELTVPGGRKRLRIEAIASIGNSIEAA